jgi:HlyD family secretion protein
MLAPLGLLGGLTLNPLLRTLYDPTSAAYSSALGYPAQQRLIGHAIEVQTIKAAQTNLTQAVAASGESAAMQQVDIRPIVSGVVEELYVSEGTQVNQGQPLLRLEQDSFQNRVDEARNNLEIAETKLKASQISIASKLAELETSVRNAEARLRNSATQIEQMDAIADAQTIARIDAARVRAESARQRLEQMETLVAEGAMSQFQLYEVQDNYAARRQELLLAEQGVFDDENSRFQNRNSYLDRQKELEVTQQALALAKQSMNQELQQLQLEVDSQRLELQQAIRDLDRTVLYAPTAGLVSIMHVHQGEFADAHARTRPPLMTLSHNVVFRAYIDQIQVGTVKVGDRANVRLVSHPGRVFQGQVVQINPRVETEAIQAPRLGTDRQYTYPVWITIPDLNIPEGVQGFVQFDLAAAQTTMTIPESAITYLSAGEGMVMTIEAGQAVIRRVQLGQLLEGQRELLSGLDTNAEIVLNPRGLHPGDRLIGKLQNASPSVAGNPLTN